MKTAFHAFLFCIAFILSASGQKLYIAVCVPHESTDCGSSDISYYTYCNREAYENSVKSAEKHAQNAHPDINYFSTYTNWKTEWGPHLGNYLVIVMGKSVKTKWGVECERTGLGVGFAQNRKDALEAAIDHLGERLSLWNRLYDEYAIIEDRELSCD